MNTRHTLWLVALAVGLFSYIYYFERNSPGPPPESWAAKLLPNFDPLSVRSVEITRTNQLIRAERPGDYWQLVTPFYPAQATAIENLLTAISRLPKRDFISSQSVLSEPGGRKAFGLEPPQVAVVLQLGAKRVRLQVGGRTPLVNQLYVQIVGEPGVYVTDSDFLGNIPSAASDWRDPLLLHLEHVSFNRLQIRSGPRTFEVQRPPTNQLWSITKPIPARADPNRVEQLIQQLRNARVAQFVTDIPTVDLEPYGLQTPEMELTVAQETNTLVVVEFGKSPTNNLNQIYARCLSHTNIVLVAKELADLLRQPYKSFHDPRLVEVQPAAVDRIEVHAGEDFSLQRQTNASWRMLEPARFAADPALVRDFLTNANALEIVDFAKDVATDQDLAQHGLAPPSRRYTFRTTLTNAAAALTNVILAQIDFGTNRLDTVYTKRSDESPIYVTRLGDSLQWPRFAFELRHRRIWDFPSSNVISVTTAHKGKAEKLTRNSAGIWSPDAIKQAALEETLFRLGQLQAISWTARGEQKWKLFGFPEAAQHLELEIKAGETNRTLALDFGHRSPSGHIYASALFEQDSQRVIFEFPGRLYQDVLRDFPFPPAAASR